MKKIALFSGSFMLVLVTLFFGESLSQVLALTLLPACIMLLIDLKGKGFYEDN